MKGQTLSPVGAIVIVTVVAVIISLTLMTYGIIRNSVSSSMGALDSDGLNDTIDTIDSNTFAAFSLSSVSVLILGAGALIGMVLILRR